MKGSSESGPIERTVYVVREHGMVDVPLEDLVSEGELAIDDSVVKRGYFGIQLKGRRLRLQARGFIGFIPLNERVAIDVRPRCPIANLAHILCVGGFAPSAIEDSARTYALDWPDLAALRDFYADALLGELERIAAFGQMREYRQRIERTPMPRGRLLMQASETRLAAEGRSPVVRASWFERTADTPANRCLKLAIWLLAQGYAATRQPSGAQRRLARRLNSAYRLFEDAALDLRLTFLDDAIVAGTALLPASRAYYRQALDVARAIVTNSGLVFDRTGTDVRLPSLVVSLERVFESYIRTVLTKGVECEDPTLSVLDGNAEGAKLFYDEQPSEWATPDIVITASDGSVPIVLDVKYKPAEREPDRVDLNQIVAYAVSYRCPRVVLVQPRASRSDRRGLFRLGAMDELEVYQYVVDLDSADLGPEEAALVREIVALS